MTVKRITRAKPRTVDDFMTVCKGYTASQVARAVNLFTPGIDWMRCSKGHMAHEWATRKSSHFRELQNLELSGLRQALLFPAETIWYDWRAFVFEHKLERDATVEQKAARRAQFEAVMVKRYAGIEPSYILYVLRHD